ncbi:TPA: urease accessory protein UreD [Pseudomonas putida]|jgi:urease accessory protein|uniref:Urease accessory protein UreD n=1 Tax=Pseudomonas putida (strain GB-1) TaxID=76869 RepID=URED_PSEPG|nr:MULTISPECIES: urease accessory protein UreD [Pseudomonas]B0KV00.1 RecName: Full=Urease accessory protein UreD [Pseudomonas putida GB-1]ABY98832.1 Urease accessory protein UreD [Pseudomonas putida GB-1]APE99137.1 urease accessory protein UreD [Pseudomonas putida]MBP0711347.1 urease accessory protein UreD [Pseudomonas sp. T34]MCE1001120.1 urease accessory protein UreD [Pseudomonas sp. NMI1173_11]MCK2190799.1 urease accessory protein UreD [Pseudomonas sp. MB04B]
MSLAEQIEQQQGDAGWSAHLQLRFVQRGDVTRLGAWKHFGPLLVQRPFYPEGSPCHVYVLHPPGGIVAGDRLELNIHLEPGSHALLTMPGASKFYRSIGPTARLTQRFHLAAGSTLEWLPQDSIFFSGARASLASRFSLEPGARLLAWETLCLGRPVMHERFDHGTLDSLLHIELPDEVGLHERLRIAGGHLDKLGGHPLLATFCAAPADQAVLEQVRSLLDELGNPAGATLLGSLLVIRLLDHDNQHLQRTLQRLWHVLRPAILGLPACPPRIWAT